MIIFRQRRVAAALVITITALCMFSLFLLVQNVSERVSESDARADHQDQVVKANQKAHTDAKAKVTALAAQLRDNGKKPIVSSQPVVVAGPPGPGPSTGQVIVAIQAYCIAHGQCRGPEGRASTVPGPTGATGAPGADSTIPGPTGPTGPAGKDGDRGPGPTDEQIAQAVADYCAAHNDCKGNQGAQGDPGPALPTP